MKNKAKLLIASFLTTLVTGMAYSNVASAASCAIISGNIYCW